MKTYFNYLLILIGAIVAIYANVEEQQNTIVLIGGIMLLMIGIYRISRAIPSKNENNSEGDKLED